MKHYNLLLVIGTTLAITVGAVLDRNLPKVNAESTAPISDSKTPINSVLASGNFVKSEHPTSGSAQIVLQNGKKYLKFSGDFKSDDGPDVFVLLHRQSSPKSYKKTDYVSLGKLQKVVGQQMYKIPNGVDIKKFKSVVIWCRQFNATFGFARLG